MNSVMVSSTNVLISEGTSQELYDTILQILSLEKDCIVKIPENSLRCINSIKDICVQAEKEEQLDGLSSWRRSHQKHKQSSNIRHNNDVKPYRVKKEESQNQQTQQNQQNQQTQQNQGYQSYSASHRYVSRFKNTSIPVEDTILNQVIMNKLNKFSSVNYDEVKSFLQQILDSDDSVFLKGFMKLVFKKAASEPTYCPLYARMLSELGTNYQTLVQELKKLYEEYLFIFEEVSEDSLKNYEEFVQRNKEKEHRLGYSQFLAELTSRGMLEIDELKCIFKKIIDQLLIHGETDVSKHQLVEEYADCLLKMTKAFREVKNQKLKEIRIQLSNHCSSYIEQMLENKSKYPGLSKKASFACMDCLDILKLL